MAEYATRMPSQLSGGQQQRCPGESAHHESIDFAARRTVVGSGPLPYGFECGPSSDVVQSLGLTFIHVTHSQQEAMSVADTVVVMNDGQIEQTDAPRKVFNEPASAFVAKFIGGHNVLSGNVVELPDKSRVLRAGHVDISLPDHASTQRRPSRFVLTKCPCARASPMHPPTRFRDELDPSSTTAPLSRLISNWMLSVV